MGGRLVRAQARGKGRAGNEHEPRPSFVTGAEVGPAPTRFTAFDLVAGADVKARLPTWDADACVRHACQRCPLLLDTSYSPMLQAGPPVVSLGSRFYTLGHACTHGPLCASHLALIQAVSCTVNGHHAQCDYRIPPDTPCPLTLPATLLQHLPGFHALRSQGTHPVGLLLGTFRIRVSLACLPA